MCVIVVDDEPLVLMLLEDILRDAGRDVVTASDGLEAFRVIDAKPCPFAALVTDYHMPYGISGADLITRVRGIYPDLPVILATAVPDSTTARWREENTVHLLRKPYMPEALVELVDRLAPL